MLDALDRYAVTTYAKYYVLFSLVTWAPIFPILLRFSSSCGYVLPVLSVLGSAALCATLLELGFQRELTTLQRYGVRRTQLSRPLLIAASLPFGAMAAFALIVAANRGVALFWSVLGLGALFVCAGIAVGGSWAKRERGIAGACVAGFACHIAVIAVGAGLLAL